MPRASWLVFVAVCAARVASGIQTQSVAAVGPQLIAGLDIAYATLGSLIGVYSLPGVAIALPGGWLMTRLGDRRMLLAALALMVLGSAAMTVAPGTFTLFAGRLLGGIGSGFFTVVGSKIVLDHVPPASLAGLMGAFVVGYPLGLALAMALLPALGSWRLAMAACALACAAGLLAAATTVPRGTVADAPGIFGVAPAGRARLLAISLAWAALNGGGMTLLSFLPPFLVSAGLTPVRAGGIASIAMFAVLPVMPFGGWLLARTVGVVPGLLASQPGLAAVALLLPAGLPPVPLLVALGIGIGLSGGPMFALAGEGLRPEERAFGMAVFFTLFYLTVAAGPALAGWVRDRTGTPAAPFYISAAFFAVCILAQAIHARLRRIALASV